MRLLSILAVGLVWPMGTVASSWAQDRVCYEYDGTGRLLSATRDDGSRLGYENDDNDNRTALARTTTGTASCPVPSGAGQAAPVGGGQGNQDPEALDDNGYAVGVSTSSFTSSIIISVLGNDSDPEGDTLSVTSVTQPSSGLASTNGTTVSFNAPTASGVFDFTYTISDGNGGTDTATVRVTVIG